MLLLFAQQKGPSTLLDMDVNKLRKMLFYCLFSIVTIPLCVSCLQQYADQGEEVCKFVNESTIDGIREFSGKATFESGGIHGVWVASLGKCNLKGSVPIDQLPDVDFDESIMSYNGEALNSNSIIVGDSKGKITCHPVPGEDRQCAVSFSEVDNIELVPR